MTTPNNRLAKKTALFSQAAEVFRLSSGEGDDAKRSGFQFEKDFPRISEIELLINKESRVHYRASDFIGNDSGVGPMSKQKEFTALLKEQRPELEDVIKRELNQAGAFFSGRVLLETVLFPKVAIIGEGLKHYFIIDVVNQDKVIVRENVSYKSLQLLPREGMLPSLSEEEKTNLERYRNSRDVQAKLEAQQADGKQALLFQEGQLLSLAIQYTLRYCKETGTYKLDAPSKEDIALSVPTSLAKGLVSGEKWTAKDKIFEFISSLVDVVKKLIIAKVRERAVIDKSRQDQAKLSEESESAFFSQRMKA